MAEEKKVRKLRLAHHRSPGDSLVLSAALRSLHTTYPDEFLVDLDCTGRDDLFLHNPDVTKMDPADCEFFNIEYGAINESNQTPVSFLDAFTRSLSEIIEKPLKLTTNRPHIVLDEEEKTWMGRVQELLGQPTPYAIVNAGYKRDYTVKGWGFKNFQELVDRTKRKVQWVQVGTSNEVHIPLDGVINQIDKTSIRELIRLVYHSRFCIGPTTLLQHIAAALQKPYVAILSGMEPLSWSSPYPTQISLSSHGRLPCCRTQACWRSRVKELPDNAEQNKSLCSLPVFNGTETIPACMQMISVERAVEAVEDLLRWGA